MEAESAKKKLRIQKYQDTCALHILGTYKNTIDRQHTAISITSVLPRDSPRQDFPSEDS